jgi:tripartite-type tricarboxylate transporter receptor subunit TctC
MKLVRLALLGLAGGMIPSKASGDALQGFIAGEITRWGKVVQQAGLAGTE